MGGQVEFLIPQKGARHIGDRSGCGFRDDLCDQRVQLLPDQQAGPDQRRRHLLQHDTVRIHDLEHAIGTRLRGIAAGNVRSGHGTCSPGPIIWGLADVVGADG